MKAIKLATSNVTGSGRLDKVTENRLNNPGLGLKKEVSIKGMSDAELINEGIRLPHIETISFKKTDDEKEDIKELKKKTKKEKFRYKINIK